MRLLPIVQETWVLPHPQEEISKKLWNVTRPVGQHALIPDVPEFDFLFNGWIKQDRFKISRVIQRGNNFLPIIYGKIESTSKGSIVFVRYQLFFATIVFLLFWTVVTLLLAVYFYVYEKLYVYSGISLAAGIVNYTVAVLNFKKQVGISSKLLQEVMY